MLQETSRPRLRIGVAAVCAATLALAPAGAARAYEVVQVTDDAHLNYMPSMLETDGGTLMMAYERLDSNFENGDIMVTTSVDGTSWTAPVPVVEGPGNERHPSLVQLPSGAFQVYYLSDETGGYRILMADSPDGVSWTPRGEVDLGWSGADQVNPTVIVEENGSLTMSYDVLSDGGYVAHSNDGTAWDHDLTKVSTGSLNRIMRHSDGTYVVSYQRKTGIWYYQIDIFTKTSADRVTWSPENRVTYTQNSHDSLPLELADGQYALYYATSTGGDPYELYSRVAPDGAAWHSEESWLAYSGWDTQPHPVRLGSGVVALAWPRGPSQTDTEVHFALLDPPTDIPGSEQVSSEESKLLRARPNPFTHSVTLTLASPLPRPARVTIYDASGRSVRTCALSTGETEFLWDGRDSGGRRVSSGIYFARSSAWEETRALKLVLLR
ncbi:MAG: hypothetical protein GF400_00585 [Candidatus Eisenbacteria bacterium]|nr:hypothetical protein [Candidatus Eisenbacteria bacterium]